MEELSVFSTLLSLVSPSALAHATDLLGNPLSLLALASVVAASLVIVLAVCHPHGGHAALLPVPVRRRTSALREHARQAAFLRLRDPGAPGRSQPRAPGLPGLAA